ncbi:MAG: ABC transporter substrate-binding protein [Terriglobia bacterium]|jgi:NitT/TauT family transport system substrate-binding protein
MTRVSVRFPIPIVESGQTPFYVAQDNGYYSDEHLAVSFQMGSRELNPVKTVATGQDMFGVLGGPDTLLVARSAGQPLRAIAVLQRNSNFSCLITLKSSGITKLSQLQGKKIGFNYGHISTDVLHTLLRRNGIHYKEVDVGFDYNQLIAGKIDAEWAFTVTAGLDLPAKGIEINIINPVGYGMVTQGYTIFATDSTIQQRPDVVLRFLQATLRGVKFAVENPEAANQTLLKQDSSLDAALSLKRLREYDAVTSDTEQYPPGYMDRSMFQDAYNRLAEEQVIRTAFDPKDAYTTQFLEEIYRRPFPK